MKYYRIEWSRTYHTTGVDYVEANSVKEAEAIAMDEIGDYNGHREIDPDHDVVYATEEMR